MRHGTLSRRLGVKTPHRQAMMRNLTLALVGSGTIKTTTARAKVFRTFVEPIVNKLKNPNLANIRYAESVLGNRDLVLKIAKEISPAFKNRSGGYLRILKLAEPRKGDMADMSLVQWTEEALLKQPEAPAKSAKKASKKATQDKEVKASSKEDKEAKGEKTEKKEKKTAKKKTEK